MVAPLETSVGRDFPCYNLCELELAKESERCSGNILASLQYMIVTKRGFQWLHVEKVTPSHMKQIDCIQGSNWASKTKQLISVQSDFPLFACSPCVTCGPARLICVM